MDSHKCHPHPDEIEFVWLSLSQPFIYFTKLVTEVTQSPSFNLDSLVHSKSILTKRFERPQNNSSAHSATQPFGANSHESVRGE